MVAARRLGVALLVLLPSAAALAGCGDDSVSIEWPEEEVRPRVWFHTTNPVVVVGDSVGVEIRARNLAREFALSLEARDTTIARVSGDFFVQGVRPGTTVLVAREEASGARDSTTVRVVPR